MAAMFLHRGWRGLWATRASLSLLCVMATLSSACSFDANKLRAPSALNARDGATDCSANSDGGTFCYGGTAGNADVLRQLLIDDAVQILFDIDVVVAVKDRAHVLVPQELMDGLAPAGPARGKPIRAVGVGPAPFVEGRGLDPSGTGAK